MTTGLFASAAGIRANQAKLNVISNNVANVNTIAFKSANVNFKSTFFSTLSAGTGPDATIGGTNPRQVGTGVAVSDIAVNFAQGGSLFTGRNTDLLISGDGFFTVQFFDESGNQEDRFTRSGNFTVDANGNLASSTGNLVLGTRTINGDNAATVRPIRLPRSLRMFKEFDPANNLVETYIGDSTSTPPVPAGGNTLVTEDASLVNFTIGTDGALSLTYSNGDRVTVTNDPANTFKEFRHVAAEGDTYTESGGGGAAGTVTILNNGGGAQVAFPEEFQMRLAKVINPEGMVFQGDSLYTLGINAGSVDYGVANFAGKGTIESGALESSNVDLGNEFTNLILAQRGLEASSRAITAQNQVLQTIINIL